MPDTQDNQKGYRVAQLDEISPVACPCGQTRRAFVAADNPVATLHMVDISSDSRAHYHQKLTEIYLVLEGEGHMELDGDIVPLRPLTSVLIKPGCRHRAVGNLRIVNIPVPAFDPTDEHFD
jgi:mannose-6-phosphate isomerase-like protein (cupin superfamily)